MWQFDPIHFIQTKTRGSAILGGALPVEILWI